MAEIEYRRASGDGRLGARLERRKSVRRAVALRAFLYTPDGAGGSR
jgi:hypothetical protein